MSPRGERWSDPFAGLPGRRLFVAVPLPDAAAAAVRAVVDEVRAVPLPDGARDVRWVRLDGLHFTLRFLGPTPDARIAPTAAAVRAVAASAVEPFDLELGGAGTFPPHGRPRALWIGIIEGADQLGRLATELEAARTFVWRAAAALDRRDSDATMLCAMAKRFGTDVGFEVANQALQLHGGYGYLSEYGIEKIVRDLRVHQILEGTNEIMRLIVSRKLIEGGR